MNNNNKNFTVGKKVTLKSIIQDKKGINPRKVVLASNEQDIAQFSRRKRQQILQQERTYTTSTYNVY